MWHTDDPRDTCQPGALIVIHDDEVGAQSAVVRGPDVVFNNRAVYAGEWPSKWVWQSAPLGPATRAVVAEAGALMLLGKDAPLEDVQRVNMRLLQGLPGMHPFFIRWYRMFERKVLDLPPRSA